MLRSVPDAKTLARATPVVANAMPSTESVSSLLRTAAAVTMTPQNLLDIDQIPTQVVRSHAEIDRTVAMTRRKKTGVLGKKKDVANEDNDVSHFLVNALAIGAGAGRAAEAPAYALMAGKEATTWTFSMKPADAAAATSMMTLLSNAVSPHRTLLGQYRPKIAEARAALPALAGSKAAKDIGAVLAKAEKALDARTKTLQLVTDLDLVTKARAIKIAQ